MIGRGVRAAVGLALGVALLAGTTFAAEPGEALHDPALEARARALSAELRCLVCENESIDQSRAPLAGDLRRLVRERIVAGHSDSQIKAELRSVYGDFVLLRPVFGWKTLALWLGPFVAAGLGLALLLLRRREQPAGPPSLSSEEMAAAEALLAGNDGPEPEGPRPSARRSRQR